MEKPAIYYINQGVREQAAERQREAAEKQADKQNEAEKQEQQKEQDASAPVKKMSSEEMQEHITLLSKAVIELTEQVKGKGE
jgi:hypothetical protein